jgi:hypothetical protein
VACDFTYGACDLTNIIPGRPTLATKGALPFAPQLQVLHIRAIQWHGQGGRRHRLLKFLGSIERLFIYRYPNKLSYLIVSDVDDAKSSYLIIF